MHFDWSPRTIKEWRDFLSRTQNTNWMQNWAYAQATRVTDRYLTRIGLIIHNDKPVGMMNVQEIKVGPLHFVNLKRGPLWFEKPSEELFLEFAKKFREEFPKSIMRRLRWMPEFELNEQTLGLLRGVGFKLHRHTFTTSWIDLIQSEESLRKSLHQKWRNCLNKSERSPLEVRVEKTSKNFAQFLRYFKLHVRQKNYDAPSEKFLQAEFKELSFQSDHYFIWALVEKTPVAGIAIVKQGRTASYRLGWTTAEGRKYNAHYALLWKALLASKQDGMTAFDVGGLIMDMSSGFSHFKLGMGGTLSKLNTLK